MQIIPKILHLTFRAGLAISVIASSGTGQVRTTFPSVAEQYDVLPNQIYRTENGWEGKLDLYLPVAGENNRIVMFIHGGGWTQSSKEIEALYVLPYLQQGWAVANVEYRLARVAPAPAAVLDCRCAFEWISANASKFRIDQQKIVTAGISAGGHLALSVATVEPSDGRAPCFESSTKPAAVINLFGPSDILELVSGPKSFPQAVEWFDGVERREKVAGLISPINRLSSSTPPVITVHGVQDDIIPYSQSVRLHQQLTKLGVRNRLVSLKSRGHGGFKTREWESSYRQIFSFVDQVTNGREGGTRTR